MADNNNTSTLGAVTNAASNAVEAITSGIANLATGAANSTTGGATTNPEEAKKQVFVGNLAFATTESDLTSLFSEAGTVASAQIITRGTRSLGYAFVTFSSEAEATKAVSLLNKREVQGREINVEGAKPQSITNKVANGEDGAKGRGSGRGARGGRGRGGAARGSARGGAARTGAPRKGAEGGAKAIGATPSGEPSQTLIFVANLPFSTDDDGLKAAFANYKITSAFVAKRFGRKSKGYGFVDAESHEEQQRIINEGKGLTIGDREVQLRVALNKADAGADEEAAPAADAAQTEATA
ncbi:hypothetical protein OC846_001345 [Tilletia horrida]|uniref:RRM domain-containing protein n=1 Tax=Tilletia horrida TaxID=155126 RepID=A0AAN6JTV7_9BASI|nr:hypothetical protein OC845_003538 [Tilletia horrida]KAK0556126.1 hypothetical protein OC846_001345 [Tilletia horrida]KAK0569052.1 hypothetical protein OC861_001294 [Tilletia horrida]